jgi:hippurate hydrolase
MHACGHDLHMSAWVAAATLLARARASWRGTLLFVGQPAEEKGGGASAMLKDGLYARFGKPAAAVAVHDTNEMEAGKVGWVAGYALANVDSVDVTVFGRGGHGAYRTAPSIPSSSPRAWWWRCRRSSRARTTRSTPPS